MEIQPFDAIYETDAHHAAVLAQAFITSHYIDDVYAILRYAERVDEKAGGFYTAYLQGCHFEPWTDHNGELISRAHLANKYKDSCDGIPGLWRL